MWPQRAKVGGFGHKFDGNHGDGHQGSRAQHSRSDSVFKAQVFLNLLKDRKTVSDRMLTQPEARLWRLEVHHHDRRNHLWTASTGPQHLGEEGHRPVRTDQTLGSQNSRDFTQKIPKVEVDPEENMVSCDVTSYIRNNRISETTATTRPDSTGRTILHPKQPFIEKNYSNICCISEWNII